jgi:hypothetical protein
MITSPSTRIRRPTAIAAVPSIERTPQSMIMSASLPVVWLSSLVAVLALFAAGIGLVWQGEKSPATFTMLRGESVELYGEGLYGYDSLFAGAGNKGTDVVTLVLGIPLLAIGVVLYRRGSPRGGLLLMGALTWFLSVYASYALGAVAYNDLFLVYVTLFSASLFALVLAFRSFDVPALPAHVAADMPRRGPAVFLVASALVTLTVWLTEPITALLTGEPPESLRTWNTLVTNALDLAVIVPLLALAAWLILRRDPLGYLIAFPLLVLEAFLAPMIVAQTLSQFSAGVELTTGEIVGPIAGFVIIAVLTAWMIIVIGRHTSDEAASSTPVPLPDRRAGTETHR